MEITSSLSYCSVTVNQMSQDFHFCGHTLEALWFLSRTVVQILEDGLRSAVQVIHLFYLLYLANFPHALQS